MNCTLHLTYSCSQCYLYKASLLLYRGRIVKVYEFPVRLVNGKITDPLHWPPWHSDLFVPERNFKQDWSLIWERILTPTPSSTIILSFVINTTVSPGEPTPPNIALQSVIPHAAPICKCNIVRPTGRFWPKRCAILLIDIAFKLVHRSLRHDEFFSGV